MLPQYARTSRIGMLLGLSLATTLGCKVESNSAQDAQNQSPEAGASGGSSSSTGRHSDPSSRPSASSSGTADGSNTGGSSTGGSSTGSLPDPDAGFVSDAGVAPLDFTGRVARYFDILVETTDAVVTRASAESVSVGVTVKLTNMGATLDLSMVQAWDLVLASGEHIPLNAPLGVNLLAGDTATVELSYTVDLPADLSGAYLELNNAARALEPEIIHLDGDIEPYRARHVLDLIGVHTAPDNGVWEFEVLDAILDLQSPGQFQRALKGTQLIQLVTNGTAHFTLESPSPVSVTVDGNTATGIIFPNGGVTNGESARIYYTLVVPKDATEARVNFEPRLGTAVTVDVDLTHLSAPCPNSICEIPSVSDAGVPDAGAPDAAAAADAGVVLDSGN